MDCYLSPETDGTNTAQNHSVEVLVRYEADRPHAQHRAAPFAVRSVHVKDHMQSRAEQAQELTFHVVWHTFIQTRIEGTMFQSHKHVHSINILNEKLIYLRCLIRV